jgi:hypothetical protein
MAIVINNTPPEFASAHDDLIFTVYESTKANDPVTYPDYRYVCDVYIGATMVVRLKSYPRPDNKRGVFNIGSVIRNYIAANFSPTDFQVRAQQMGVGEFFIKATVKFGEEYNFVLYTNLTVDSERTYYNNYIGRLVTSTQPLYSVQNKIASARPRTPINRSATRCFLAYFPANADPVSMRVRTYSGSVMVDSRTESFTPDAAFTLQLFNVAPNTLNALWPGIINDAVDNYSVELLSEVPYTIRRFDLVCEPRYSVYYLHFLNRYGGFDTKEFSKVSRKEINITKEEFGRTPYMIDASGMVSYYNSNNVYHESRATYSSQYSEKMTLNTDILTDEEYQWLGDLALSPLVYFEDFGHYVPVSVSMPTYDFRKRINDKLTNLPVVIEFGNQLNAQYR